MAPTDHDTHAKASSRKRTPQKTNQQESKVYGEGFPSYPADDGSPVFALLCQARLAMNNEDNVTAKRHLSAAITKARSAGQRELEIWGLSMYATTHAVVGLQDDGITYATTALEMAREIDDQVLIARALFSIGFVAIEANDQPRAIDMLKRSLAHARIAKSDYDEFWSLNNLSHLYGDAAYNAHIAGDREACEDSYWPLLQYATEALAVTKRTNNWMHRCYCLTNLGVAALIRGDYVAAKSIVARFRRLAHHYKAPRLMAYANLDRSRILTAEGRTDEAIACIGAPDHLAELCLTDDLRLATHDALASLYKSKEDYKQALFHHEAARSIECKVHEIKAARHLQAVTAKLNTEEALAETRRLQIEAEVLEDRNKKLERDRVALERSAQHDALTGLGNRRAADAALARRLDDAQTQKIPFSVAYVDLDQFKAINDRFGHQIGDKVLVAIGGLLQGNMRGMDKVFRIGGEEFLILITSSATFSGIAACERLRQVIADHDWSDIHPELGVTASFGLTRWNGEEDSDETVARADAALYAAKDAGRNRVMCH